MSILKPFNTGIFVLIFMLVLITPLHAEQTDTAQVDPQFLSETDMDDLVAPIALYPDALLAHVLPAATQPLQVVQAARYIKDHDGKVDAIPDNDWETSIKALLEAPDILTMMNEKLSWTVQLGDAVITQQDGVLSAIQRVRSAAQEAGKLESNEKQIIIVEKEIIKIQPPPESQIVYVPTTYYVPSSHTTVVYDYHHHSDAEMFAGFTMGILFGAMIADDHWHHHHHVDWHHGHISHGWSGSDIDIDIDRGDINIGGGDRNIDLGDRELNIDKNKLKNNVKNRDFNKDNIKSRAKNQQWKPSKKARQQYQARSGKQSKIQREQLRSKVGGKQGLSSGSLSRYSSQNWKSTNRQAKANRTSLQNRKSTNRQSLTNKSAFRNPQKLNNRKLQQSKTNRLNTNRSAFSRNSVFGNARSSGSATRKFSNRGKASRAGLSSQGARASRSGAGLRRR